MKMADYSPGSRIRNDATGIYSYMDCKLAPNAYTVSHEYNLIATSLRPRVLHVADEIDVSTLTHTRTHAHPVCLMTPPSLSLSIYIYICI